MRSFHFFFSRFAARRALFFRLTAPVAASLLTVIPGGVSRAEDPPRYIAVDLGAVPLDSSQGDSWTAGINAAGEVVGTRLQRSSTPPSRSYPLLFSGGGVTDLNAGGGNSGAAYDVNNSGAVVGNAVSSTGLNHAFQWTSAGAVDLGTLGDPLTQPGLSSSAWSLNDTGLITGWSAGPDGTGSRAVTWRNGVITALDTLGGIQGGAVDANNSGLIVGYSTTAAGPETRATMWKDGSAAATELESLGGRTSIAEGVNEAGWIVGWSTLRGEAATRAVLWKDGAAIDLGAPPGAVNSFALGINAAGDIIGGYDGGGVSGYSDPFLYTNGVMYDFRSLLVPESPVRDIELNGFAKINDAGQFAGTATYQGATHFFLLTPVGVPEPSAAGLTLLSLAGALFSRRRRST